MKALILTGGAGRNLVPFSATRPKAMTVVGGGSLMARTLAHLREVGVTDVTVVLGQTGEKVKAVFEEGQDFGVHITYVEQGPQGGIVDAILGARRRFIPGEYFILVYGDVVTSANPFHQALQSFNSFKAPIACVCLPGPPTARYGNVYLSGTRITRIVEKPTTAGLGNYVLAGVFVLPVGSVFADGEERGRHGGGLQPSRAHPGPERLHLGGRLDRHRVPVGYPGRQPHGDGHVGGGDASRATR